MKIGKPELLSEMNKKLILDYLRKEGPKSRADVKRKLGLSFPTVSTNVKDLIEGNMILEIGISDNAMGRKGTLLKFNSKMGYVLGIDMGRSHIRMMICDISGDVICSSVSDQFTQKTTQGVLDQIDDEFERILQKGCISKNNLLYISIGIPGIVDEIEGKHRLAPFIEIFKDIRIDTYMREKYQIKTLCGNSVDFGAIGEKWKGAGKEYKNIIYLDYGIGIGCSLILNGELYTGRNGAAGEVGYMLPGIQFERYEYDEEGVMEKLIAGSELEKRMITQNNLPYTSIKELFERDIEGQFVGSELILEIKKYIGILLVNLVSIINPEVIIIGGGIGKQLALKYADYFEHYLRAYVPYVPQIVPTKLDDKANLLGAVAYALRNIHEEYASLEAINMQNLATIPNEVKVII